MYSTYKNQRKIHHKGHGFAQPIKWEWVFDTCTLTVFYSEFLCNPEGVIFKTRLISQTPKRWDITMYEARERKTCRVVEAWVQEEGAAEVEDLTGGATLMR